MKSRTRVPTMLAAAAVVCGSNSYGVESASASVRGGKDGGSGINSGSGTKRRQQHIDQHAYVHESSDGHKPQHHQLDTSSSSSATTIDPGRIRRSLQNKSQQQSSFSHWWHNNKSNEKDIAVQPLGPHGMGVGSNVNPNKLQQMHNDGNNHQDKKPDGALDDGSVAFAGSTTNNGGSMQMQSSSSGGGGGGGGRESFSVYAINVDNSPDTSDLPHRQPTQTPTPRPTRAPSKAPTPKPTVAPQEKIMVQQSSQSSTFTSAGNLDDDDEGMIYYPLWTNSYHGCTSALASGSPPSSYTANPTISHMYLFSTRYECCSAWFAQESMGSNCLQLLSDTDNEGGGGGDNDGLLVQMQEEAGAQYGEGLVIPQEDEPATVYSSASSSNDNGGGEKNKPKPPPPSPPAAKPNPPPPAPKPQPDPQPTPPVTTPSTPKDEPVVSNPQAVTPQPTPPPQPQPQPDTINVQDGFVKDDTPSPTPFDDTPSPTEWPTFADQDDGDDRDPFLVDPFLPPGPSPNTNEPVVGFELSAKPTVQGSNENTSFASGETLIPTWIPTQSPVERPAFDQFADENNIEALYHPAASIVNDDGSTAVYYEEGFEGGGVTNNDHFTWEVRGNTQWTTVEVLSEQREESSYDGGMFVAEVRGSGNFALESTLSLVVDLNSVNVDDNEENELQQLKDHGGYLTFGINALVHYPKEEEFQLIFKVNDAIMGYWTEPTLNTNEGDVSSSGWESVSAYLPPMYMLPVGEQKHVLTWQYSYYGRGSSSGSSNQEEGDDKDMAVQLDGLKLLGLSGDYEISDDDLYSFKVDDVPLPSAMTLHVPTSDASWEVLRDNNAYDGDYVLMAMTRRIIRAANPGMNVISTYHGSATMSFTVVTGPFGGVFYFSIFSEVNTPIDVLEVGLDGERIMAATGNNANGKWEDHTLELNDPGQHVITFTHISNPAFLDKSTLENMGSPGQSKVDGIGYRDSIDPADVTPEPTMEPTPEPTLSPTPLPPQNYCGKSLSIIQSQCWRGTVPTCNDDDVDPCPIGTYCWGSIECQVPEGMSSKLDTDTPTESPTPVQADAAPATTVTQNYCGKSLGAIKATCARGNVPTCNDDDGPCPAGTYCWGNIECDLAEDETPPPPPTPPPSTPVQEDAAPAPQNYCGTNLNQIKAKCAGGTVKTCNDDDGPCPVGTFCWGNIECDPIEASPTPSPTKEKTVASFLDTFFGTGGSIGVTESSSEDNMEQMVATLEEEEEEEEEEKTWTCSNDLVPAPGLPGCCVSDPSFLGDGACDAYEPYNTAECGYDLGDCCRESCDPNTPFGCAAKEGDDYGPFGYYCIDPEYGNVEEDECQAENREWIGDGGCDPEYNTAACGWDGGDCCRQSCDAEFAYYECGREAQPFDCKNPDIIYRADYVP